MYDRKVSTEIFFLKRYVYTHLLLIKLGEK